MHSQRNDWACDQCGDTKETASASPPTHWRVLHLVEGGDTLKRWDFCSTECLSKWREEHKV